MRQHLKKNQFRSPSVLAIPHLFINPRIEQPGCVEPRQSLDMEENLKEQNRRASR